LSSCGKPQSALIWHIGMLRLLPFLRVGSAHIALFLHGVEVWRRHDPLTRLLLPRVNLFLSNSDYTWQHFLHYYPALDNKPHQIVHLGLGDPVTVLTQPTIPPTALILSRLDRREDYKGHRELITAWPLVLQRIPNAELWVAGDGDLRSDLERSVREQGLERQIRFFGRVSEEQKQDLLARCRCFAMPSRGEGFGLVYLEAMRLGRPCLVSNCDAGREVVNPPEAGLAANPDDAHALTAALLRLLSPGKEWEQWSEQAHRRYARQFTARHYQQRLVTALGLTG
jgi:phosphatidylinositol alpha-1,6-mannosyltransferase